MKFIADTGQPELCEGLFNGPIPKDARYKILRRVHIDRKQRPNKDLAPCPMCTKNRFIHGSLVHLYELGICAVIGRCCADNADSSERDYERKRLLDWQEDYLLSALPILHEKKLKVEQTKWIAQELQRVYRKIRREAPHFHLQLRNLKENNNARISLFEEENDDVRRDYFGPAGFKGGDSTRGVREIFFGPLRGTTLAIRDYRPVVELADVERNISLFPFAGTEEQAVDFIASLDDKHRTVAVAALQLADNNYLRFAGRACDVLEFFSNENIENLNRLGTHNMNPLQFQIAIKVVGNKHGFSIEWGRDRSQILIDSRVFQFDFSWKNVPYQRFRRTD